MINIEIDVPVKSFENLRFERSGIPSEYPREFKCLLEWMTHPSNESSYVAVTKYDAVKPDEEYELSAKLWMEFARVAGLTAYINDNPVAMAVLQPEIFRRIRHTAELSIIVDPKAQRMGIGKAMIGAICQFGKQVFKLERVHIQVHGGSKSYNFYKNLDFQEFGRQKRWIKEEDGSYRSRIFMEKKID